MARRTATIEELPSREEILALYSYDPVTGFFSWRHDFGMPKGGVKFRQGSRAGSRNKSTGYRCIGINGRIYQEHRIAWFLMTGKSPLLLDHKNGVKDDNSLDNLRPATESQNGQNRRAYSRVGTKGIHKLANGKYRVRIGMNGKRKLIGDFFSLEMARSAYALNAIESFGEYARIS